MNRNLRLSIALAASFLPILAGCTTVIDSRPAASPATASLESSEDDEVLDLLATMKGDLTRASRRAEATPPAAGPAPRQLSSPAGTTAPLSRPSIDLNSMIVSIPMPLVGHTASELEDNFGEPRDGGKRRHRGIDIFAPRGTEIVAVESGTLSYIGEQPKGGRCLWLVGDSGVAYYYAHLDRWASGIYEGMPIRRGDLLGFVGTTGNAKHTPPHLHFAVLKDDEALNPYPLLRGATLTLTRHDGSAVGVLQGGFHSAQ